jgi:hypothetical protein
MPWCAPFYDSATLSQPATLRFPSSLPTPPLRRASSYPTPSTEMRACCRTGGALWCVHEPPSACAVRVCVSCCALPLGRGGGGHEGVYVVRLSYTRCWSRCRALRADPLQFRRRCGCGVLSLLVQGVTPLPWLCSTCWLLVAGACPPLLWTTPQARAGSLTPRWLGARRTGNSRCVGAGVKPSV